MRSPAPAILLLGLLATLHGAHAANSPAGSGGECTELSLSATAPANASSGFGGWDQFNKPNGTDYSEMIPASGGPGLYFPEGVNATEAFAAFEAAPYFQAAAKEHAERAPALLEACAKKQGASECNATALALEDFAELYAAAPFPPVLAPFWDSDAAFGRMRISVGPLLLRLATALPEGMKAEDIEGLDAIIAGTGLSLDELIAAKRLFVQDYLPFADTMKASPGHVLEAPTALFFLDGPADAADAPLMPLAIKFNLQNQNVYSPKDSRADWLLAKMHFNAIDVHFLASLHFLYHLILENVCISGRRNLGPTHPLSDLISIPCTSNTGIVSAAPPALFDKGAAFDALFVSAGQETVDLFAVKLRDEYDWEGTYLEEDVAARGLDAIPPGAFPYRDDAAPLYAALLDYATAIIQAHYGEGAKAAAAIKADAQLNAFLADLSEGGDGEIQSFPGPAHVKSVEDLARVIAKTMWFGGGQHHTLNSNKMPNNDMIYPVAPSKIFAAAPEEKGVLAESQLVSEYLLPTQSVLGEGDVVNGTTFWQTATALVSNFLLPDDEGSLAKRLPRCYASAAEEAEGCPKAAAQAAAAKKLGAELERIGAAIEAREKSTEGKLPRYDLLIPANLPCGTTI